jgi:hypothetical protein
LGKLKTMAGRRRHKATMGHHPFNVGGQFVGYIFRKGPFLAPVRRR